MRRWADASLGGAICEAPPVYIPVTGASTKAVSLERLYQIPFFGADILVGTFMDRLTDAAARKRIEAIVVRNMAAAMRQAQLLLALAERYPYDACSVDMALMVCHEFEQMREFALEILGCA